MQCQSAIIRILLGQNYNTFWIVCVIGICRIFLIKTSAARFAIFQPPFPNVPFVSNILPRLYYYKVLLCRLVWLTEIQSPKGGISNKKQNIEKKNQILCTFVALF